jgi:general secretion pathway protein J
MKMNSRKRGFTLVEVLLASIIGVFIALVAVGTLKVVTDSAGMVEESMSTAAEVQYAANMIQRDLTNFYRDKESENTRLVGFDNQNPDAPSSQIVFYTVGRVKARYGQPESDIYEVEYLLRQEDSDSKSDLYRRLWPNPNKESQPGGVLTRIAEGIDLFSIRYFDGEEWQFEWPEDMGKMPELIEVTIGSGQPGDKAPVVETFLVNFHRSDLGSGSNKNSENESERSKDDEK